MAFHISSQGSLKPTESFDLLVLPFWEGPADAADFSAWKQVVSPALASGDFLGKLGEALVIYGSSRVMLLGLGKKDVANDESFRRSYAAAVRIAQAKKVKSLHLIVPSGVSRQQAVAIAEGIHLTNYAFTKLKHDSLKENPVVLLEKAVLVGLDKKFDELLEKQRVLASAIHMVRDLVNGNADDVTPQMLADQARLMAKQTKGLRVSVLERKEIEEEKMGLLLAVNRGSSLDPRLIVLSYQGNPASKEHIALIGKGITYDTGGLALKPVDNMVSMRTDMAGAATVLAAVQTAAALKLKVNVSAVVPATENGIDADSYKLGDVYRSMSGKTVEVNNTDAEGRLVLADAMTYAISHLKPTKLIDVATLTGGIIVALGEEIAGVFCNNQDLAECLQTSSEATGELICRLPLHAEYKEMLKSDNADLLNSAGRWASAMTAALFLQEFCDSLPWAHLDIAGTSYWTKPKHYNPSKATGFGVRLLVDFLERSAP